MIDDPVNLCELELIFLMPPVSSLWITVESVTMKLVPPAHFQVLTVMGTDGFFLFRPCPSTFKVRVPGLHPICGSLPTPYVNSIVTVQLTMTMPRF
ncbi:hypothetical protein ABKN59_009438 [Abortiporus biennis]